MNGYEATLVLRRLLPNIPQRTLANAIAQADSPPYAGALDPYGYYDLSGVSRSAFDSAFTAAVLGGDREPVPGWATIYSRIRRADSKIKNEAASVAFAQASV